MNYVEAALSGQQEAAQLIEAVAEHYETGQLAWKTGSSIETQDGVPSLCVINALDMVGSALGLGVVSSIGALQSHLGQAIGREPRTMSVSWWNDEQTDPAVVIDALKQVASIIRNKAVAA